MKKFTTEQQQVIDFRGRRLLVSASAGTGKTTVMIQRILSLLEGGADISQFVVVTFTNLAAAEMKARLARELSNFGTDRRMVEQLEKLDNANISTIHSFCSELLRNYFYLVDIDPDFSILDNVTVANIKNDALEEVFAEYSQSNDDLFRRVRKIFTKNRQEQFFRDTILGLYEFARGLENFGEWYVAKRKNFIEYSDDNPVVTTLLADIRSTLDYVKTNFADIAERASEESVEACAEVCRENVARCSFATDNLATTVTNLATTTLVKLPKRNKKKPMCVDGEIEEKLRSDFDSVYKTYDELAEKYQKLFRGMSMETLWQQTVDSVTYTDKLVEIVQRFEEKYYAAKRQRGTIDFGDLEHLALKVLRNEEAAKEIGARYKYVFVDEYQDTSPIQEELVRALGGADLFMVGDVKQSIYGFRGCEPEIFLDKYNRYKSGQEGTAVKLNKNFRTNNEIFDFVNDLFCYVMTENFGRVNYATDAMLNGPNGRTVDLPSVLVNLVCLPNEEPSEVVGMYDITDVSSPEEGLSQAAVIVSNIKNYVGTTYEVDGKTRSIDYGDIVILTRSLRGKAEDIYDALVEANIPVVANFKTDGYASKEVRDIVNLLRIVDNPYNDVYLVGVCLSCFGNFTEAELGKIRLDTKGRVPFYDRLRAYCKSFPDSEITKKIDTLLNFIDKVRFFSHGATVCETVLYVLKLTDYALYVEGLPNGGLRVRKLYAFVDGVRDAAYGQSVDKFLQFIDQSEDNAVEEGLGNVNAVRMMTMHASKGLEFPVVIVAATEGRFNLLPEQVERNVDMGVAINYYNFDNMRVSGTMGATACGMFNKTKQREEEMRLLYVALTRAKYLLNVVGNVTEKQLTDLPKQPDKAMSHMDWIVSMLVSKYNPLEKNGNKLKVVVNRDMPQDSETAIVDRMCPQYDNVDKVLMQMNYVYPYLNQTGMPLKVVSSALDKEALALLEQSDVEEEQVEEVLVDDYLPEGTTKAAVKDASKKSPYKPTQKSMDEQAERNKVGTAYHKVLQYLPLDATEADVKALIERLVAEEKTEQRYADGVDVASVCAVVNKPEYKQIVTSGQAYRELPFMLFVPYDKLVEGSRYTDKVMLQGVIDLLVVEKNHAIVVDYKYTRNSEGLRERYRAQLNSYRLAVEEIFGITDVDCYILSIADNKLVKM